MGWVGEVSSWKKKRGKARIKVPEFKLLYGDFIDTFKNLNIDWCSQTNKIIYNTINDYLYGGVVIYRNLTQQQSQDCVKYVYCKLLSEYMRDISWLVAVRRLPVRTVVSWSCYVTTKKCPMTYCKVDETLEHFLIECPRAIKIWILMKSIGLKINVNMSSLSFGYFNEHLSMKEKEFYMFVFGVVKTKMWKTRCKMTLDRVYITPETLFKQIQVELKRRKTLDLKSGSDLPWHLINL